MTRRSKKTSTAEDVVEMISHMPWWVGVVIALVLYLWLHALATRSMPAITGQPGQIGALLGQTIARTFSALGQYLLPALCLIGAGISAFRRHQRSQLFAAVAESTEPASLDGMTWGEFEMLVGEAYRRRGYQVVARGGSSADGGVDLVLLKDGAKYYVQCKQWKALKVGVEVIRQLKGVMAAHGAHGGFVVTSGRFTDDATAFARTAGVSLVDGAELHSLIRGVPRSSSAGPVMRTQATSGETLPPSCPKCSRLMKSKTARRGSNAGQEFWGCTAYPECRGTRALV